MDNARYNIVNEPDVVRLNFTNILMTDMGIWRCNVTVKSERHVQSGDTLVLLEEATIGSIIVNIQLIIVCKLTLIILVLNACI